MKNKYTILAFALFSVCTTGCYDNVGEVIESSYIENVWVEPEYKFTRNGISNVDVQECLFLKEPIDYFYNSYLKSARIMNESAWETARTYFQQGEYGLSPREELATSAAHVADREKIVADFEKWIDTSRRISGYYVDNQNKNNHRNRDAEPGISGYVGQNVGDANIFFVDEKGFVVAEVFRYAIMGAIYLDKILNVHLLEEDVFSPEVCGAHENLELMKGRNYTQLEHHLDLAKGYYDFWKPLAAAEGIPALKESDRKIFYALVQARRLLEHYQYDEAKPELAVVRSELSRVVAIRVMNLLLGPNTIVNVQEESKYAFTFLSQACGLIYSLQFTINENGIPYFSYQEVQDMLALLVQGQGLWEKERLLSGDDVPGSLRNIALQVGNRFGISIEEIER